MFGRWALLHRITTVKMYLSTKLAQLRKILDLVENFVLGILDFPRFLAQVIAIRK